MVNLHGLTRSRVLIDTRLRRDAMSRIDRCMLLTMPSPDTPLSNPIVLFGLHIVRQSKGRWSRHVAGSLARSIKSMLRRDGKGPAERFGTLACKRASAKRSSIIEKPPSFAVVRYSVIAAVCGRVLQAPASEACL